MRGGYGYALFLVLIFACLQTSGCHSGGTPLLKVTVTSLPNGIVGSPYVASLTASGGTPSYTWSQTSGGAMPDGISVGSNGVFVGSPSKAGNFGPYIFEVTDSTGLVASSAGLSITVTTTTLTVITTALPPATIATPYSVTLGASGGNLPYSWSETSGGALPPGISNITPEGLLTGTPTATGTFGPYVFTVTDSTNTTAATASLTLTVSAPSAAACTPLGNEAALTASTPYAFLLKGTDGSGNPIDIAGSFTPNGSGGITQAIADDNGLSNGPQQLQVDLAASSYSFAASHQGCLYLALSTSQDGAANSKRTHVSTNLERPASGRARMGKALVAANPAAANVQFAFALSGFDGTVYNTGRIIERDNVGVGGAGTNATGFIHVQAPTAFGLTSLQSNYAFGVDGWTADSNGFFRTAIAGSFTNSSGALSSGYADLNEGGTPSGELTGGSGTLNSSIDATTGRGTGSYTIPTTNGNLTFDFAFYILNRTDFILLSTDSSIAVGSAPLLAGRALASGANDSQITLNGYYLLASEGLVVNGGSIANLSTIGTVSATSAGAIPLATLYVNNAGAAAATPYSNGSYTIEAASGRVSTSGISSASPTFYLTLPSTSDDQITGFLVGSDSEASSGLVYNQSTAVPSYSTSSLLTSYAASTQEDVDGLNGAMVGNFLFTQTSQYTSVQTTTGTTPNLPISTSFTINADGSGYLNDLAMTGEKDLAAFAFVTNGATILAIPNSGDPQLYVFTAVTLPN